MNVEKHERVLALQDDLRSAKHEYERNAGYWSDEVASLARERMWDLAPLLGWPSDDDQLTEVVLERGCDGADYLRIHSVTVGGHDGGDYWLPLAWWAMDAEEWTRNVQALHNSPALAKMALREVKTGPKPRALYEAVDALVEKATRRFNERVAAGENPDEIIVAALMSIIRN